jgi:hypothetical protein
MRIEVCEQLNPLLAAKLVVLRKSVQATEFLVLRKIGSGGDGSCHSAE